MTHPTPDLPITHLTQEQLDDGLAGTRQSPPDHGTVELISCRPAVGERTVLETATLDLSAGLVGDSWVSRRSRTPDGSPNPEAQVTLMNARVIALLAGDRDHWPISGDQLYVDLDLALDNLSTGTRLQIGEAVLEVT